MFKGFLTTISVVALSFICWGQNVSETMALADDMYDEGNYIQAIELYKRVAFFSEENSLTNIYSSIALCNEKNKCYKEAVTYYELATNVSVSDDQVNAFVLGKCKNLVLQEKYHLALQNLYQLNIDTDSSLYSEFQFYLGISLFGIDHFAEANDHFKLCTDSIKWEALDNAYRQVHSIERMRSNKAQTMSLILPGLGQLYAGDIKNALNSSLLNAGLLTLAIYVMNKYSALDAVISVLPWYRRYFVGGIKHAGIIADEKRYSRKTDLFIEILDIIDNKQS